MDELIAKALKLVCAKYGSTIVNDNNRKMTVDSVTITTVEMAQAVGITRDQANKLKRALMKRGLVTQTLRNKGPAILTWHYPPLPREQRQSHRLRNVQPAPPTPKQPTPEQVQAAMHFQGVTPMHLRPYSVEFAKTFKIDGGRYTAQALRELVGDVATELGCTLVSLDDLEQLKAKK